MVRFIDYRYVRLLSCMLAFGSFGLHVNAQSTYQPYSYHFYQKLNSELYHLDTRYHTAVKPMIIDNTLRLRYDSLMQIGVRERSSWWGRKLYNEHLVDIKKDDHTFYADFLPDFQIGRDFAGDGRTTWLNTRGAQAGLTVGDRFSLYVNIFENQAMFPGYLDDYITRTTVTPGQGYGKTVSETGKKDWMYTTANVSYTVNDYLNVTLAYDKNFIGDGYRSMLLSDVSSNYTALKLTGKIGNVQYLSMWAYMLDPMHPRSSDYWVRLGDNWKWGAFQYLDWNVNNRLSVGLFQSVVWGARNAAGRRGFDFNYLNPIIVLRPVELTNTSSPDKIHLGLNTKYKVLKNMAVYGQFLLGEFTASEFFGGEGHVNNKWGAQLGFRGYDAFGIKNLNFLGEFNTARPYTYTHFDPVSNYSNYGEALAHPWGANFREFVGILNYSYKRFDFSFQGTWGQFGTDPDSITNYGKDIFKPYDTHLRVYGNYIGQGIKNNLLYADGRVSYLLNPKYNLRVEAGGVYRRHSVPEQGKHHQTGMLTLGLRASFRNFYYDF
ncbi:gliding motility protein RemB [Parapedobacter tibetensis]|uniref:gliding motility protein RemB n=1 Tax=Parapedobacter tibetensis TaxID=2972951 RepID=UPI00214DD0CE|nr:gliding motility protein RemB [Parapedobacter tibetensis]